MGRNGFESAKRIADVKEAVDLFVNRFRSSRGSLVIRDALVVGENHGCPHVSGEHFVDGRPTPLAVVLCRSLGRTKKESAIASQGTEKLDVGPGNNAPRRSRVFRFGWPTKSRAKELDDMPRA